MQIARAIANVGVYDAAGNPLYRLAKNRAYLLHDDEADRGVRDGALTIVGPAEERIARYDGGPLDDQRLLLPFIGKLGDAVATASCVAATTRTFPRAEVTIAAPPAARSVFQLFPQAANTCAYPVPAEALDAFDLLMSFDDVDGVADGGDRSLADAFSRCLRTPRPDAPAAVRVPSDALARWSFDAYGPPRVALHAGPTGSLRSYPLDLTGALATALAREGIDVFLIGVDTPGGRRPASIPGVVDLIGHTPTPADLAAMLRGMSVLVTCDSFPMHLAGAMGIPTIGLFTCTTPALADDYPSVTAVSSSASCAPCHVVEGACPLGHPGCIAFIDPILEPEGLARRVLAHCEAMASA